MIREMRIRNYRPRSINTYVSVISHPLEQGTNIKIIQRLLGHHSIRTTMVYLQVAKIDPKAVSSPFDNLKF